MSTYGFIARVWSGMMGNAARGRIDQEVGDGRRDRSGVRLAEECERACGVELEEDVAPIGPHDEIDGAVVEAEVVEQGEQAVGERARQLVRRPRGRKVAGIAVAPPVEIAAGARGCFEGRAEQTL